MAGNPPVQRLVARDIESGEYLPIGAVWEDSQGRRSFSPGGRMPESPDSQNWVDVRVRVIVELPSGEEVEISRDTHYLDFKDVGGGGQRRAASQRAGAGSDRTRVRTRTRRAPPPADGADEQF